MSFPIHPSMIRTKEDMAETEIRNEYVKKNLAHKLKKAFYKFMGEPLPEENIDREGYKAEIAEERLRTERERVEKENAKAAHVQEKQAKKEQAKPEKQQTKAEEKITKAEEKATKEGVNGNLKAENGVDLAGQSAAKQAKKKDGNEAAKAAPTVEPKTPYQLTTISDVLQNQKGEFARIRSDGIPLIHATAPAAQLGQPAQHGQSAQRGQPIQNDQPAQHGQPVQHGQSAQRGQPIQHGQPVQHGQSAQRGQPVQRGQPAQHGQPVQHGQSAQRGQPVQHGQPVQRGQPIQHGQPVQHGQSAQRGQPAQHGQPAQRDQPAQHGQPVQRFQVVDHLRQPGSANRLHPADRSQAGNRLQAHPVEARPRSYHGDIISGTHPSLDADGDGPDRAGSRFAPRQPIHRRSMPLDPETIHYMIDGPSQIPDAGQIEDSPFLPTQPRRRMVLHILGHEMTEVEQAAWDYVDIRRDSLARGEVPPQAPAGFHEVDLSELEERLDMFTDFYREYVQRMGGREVFVLTRLAPTSELSRGVAAGSDVPKQKVPDCRM